MDACLLLDQVSMWTNPPHLLNCVSQFPHASPSTRLRIILVRAFTQAAKIEFHSTGSGTIESMLGASTQDKRYIGKLYTRKGTHNM